MSSVLKKFLKQNSYSKIRSRARSIEPLLISKNSTDYIFIYVGSEDRKYTIRVSLKEGEVVSHCSCPYDYGGLCKHEVAAINSIISEREKTGKKDRSKLQSQKNINANQIILKNHLITENTIQNLRQNLGTRINPLDMYAVNIDKVNENHVSTVFRAEPNCKQNLNYNPASKALTIECSCKQKSNGLCDHMVLALRATTNHFGENIFHPNYLKEKINNFLSKRGMTPKDNYHDFFSFSLGIEGLQVTEKAKNVVPSIGNIKQDILSELDAHTKDFVLLNDSHLDKKPGQGVAFCIENVYMRNFQFFRLLPLKAGFKKNSNELLATLKEIHLGNLIHTFSTISEKDKKNVLAALELEDSNDDFQRNMDIGNLKKTLVAFKRFIPTVSGYDLYIKEEGQRLSSKSLTRVAVAGKNSTLQFGLTQNGSFYCLKPYLKLNRRIIELQDPSLVIYPYFCLVNHKLYFYENAAVFVYILRFLNLSELNFHKKEYDKLYSEIIKPLSEFFEIETQIYEKKESTKDIVSAKKQLYLSDYEGTNVLFKPAVLYDDKLVLLHSKEQLFDEKTQNIMLRNKAFENQFLVYFKALHPDFEHQEHVFSLQPEQLIENNWLLEASRKMKEQNITLFGVKNLKSFKYNLNQPVVSMSVSQEVDWFDLEIEISYGDEKVSLKEVRNALLKKSRYVQLSDGTLGLLPEKWLDKFSNYLKAGEVKANGIKLSNYQFNIIDELVEELEKTPQFLKQLQKKKKRLQNLATGQDISPPKALKANLRPYQHQGLNWLVFLNQNNLGGCLADDMGLGKTLQTIAFLQYLKEKNGVKKPHLVIAPTSLVFNWQNEIDKFCPSLLVINYTGVKRKEHLPTIGKCDIVLTTYGTVLKDIELLKDKKFEYVILDESQAIKNPNSKRYKAVRLLQSANRLALTGTPIENNTFDLFSQMNFLNPGLLGSMAHFKTAFSDPIDKHKNEESSKLLSKMIHPFLLRRTKKQVAKELPEKTEMILYCDMSIGQRKVYDLFKNKYRDYLLNKFKEEGESKSQMYVLEGLVKLRQICNSPQLLNNTEDYGKESVKLDMLIDNLKTKTIDHKVLVFSQFTGMLKLVKERLEHENIMYQYLDGQSKKREALVTDFQENEELRVFLISLKAGGTGLNLTAADYVFLIDPWWNPAVENQAIDRCYRIGQTKHVLAYKMICRNTIEEKIVDLQKNKLQVSESVIQTDRLKKSFNTKEIKDLFA